MSRLIAIAVTIAAAITATIATAIVIALVLASDICCGILQLFGLEVLSWLIRGARRHFQVK